MKNESVSKSRRITGMVLSYIVILFMLFDAIFKFFAPAVAVEVTVNELGYAEQHLVIMGILALVPTLLYIYPKTAFWGAVLLTAYFGGAIATHLRVNNPLFSHILFPVYLAIMMWGGLWLRNSRIKAVFSI